MNLSSIFEIKGLSATSLAMDIIYRRSIIDVDVKIKVFLFILLNYNMLILLITEKGELGT